MTKLLLIGVLTLGLSGTALAAVMVADKSLSGHLSYLAVNSATSPARDFVEQMGTSAISFLGNESFSQSQKESEFKKLLRNSFDMKTIGRFALGSYWNTASAQQREEYLRLFETMVIRVYAARFNEYDGQKLDVASFREDGKDTLVTSYIVSPQSGEKIKVDWRVRNKGGAHKIVDVIIEGVSMAMTQRSDFSSVIQRGGGNVQVLIDHLKKENS